VGGTFFLQTDKMIVAITGATGLIGSRLVERLDAGNAAK
jgi:aspartate-semialdehyde dehydrogenase